MKRAAINGLSRKGRVILRMIMARNDIQLIAVNDQTALPRLADLLKYDTIYGKYNKEIRTGNASLFIDGKEIKVFSENDPSRLPWNELNIDIVFDGRGSFTDIKELKRSMNEAVKNASISSTTTNAETPISLADKVKWFFSVYFLNLS
jgi:glyceraldehyde 3-phosphate dehydrogenase